MWSVRSFGHRSWSSTLTTRPSLVVARPHPALRVAHDRHLARVRRTQHAVDEGLQLAGGRGNVAHAVDARHRTVAVVEREDAVVQSLERPRGRVPEEALVEERAVE